MCVCVCVCVCVCAVADYNDDVSPRGKPIMEEITTGDSPAARHAPGTIPDDDIVPASVTSRRQVKARKKKHKKR
jgi:hypothetical protein